MLKNKIRLAVVDDHPLIIEGLKKLLDQQNNINVIGTFNKGNDLLDFLKSNIIDIILLDVTLPDINGVDLCLEIKKNRPRTSIIGISNHTERSIIIKMLKNGASGYLLKSTTIAELLECITEAVEGKITFSKEVQSIIAEQTPSDYQEIVQLTKREKEILKLIALGKTTQNIADELYLSKLTIETHRKNILAKFEAKNVAELIKIASVENLL